MSKEHKTSLLDKFIFGAKTASAVINVIIFAGLMVLMYVNPGEIDRQRFLHHCERLERIVGGLDSIADQFSSHLRDLTGLHTKNSLGCSLDGGGFSGYSSKVVDLFSEFPDHFVQKMSMPSDGNSSGYKSRSAKVNDLMGESTGVSINRASFRPVENNVSISYPVAHSESIRAKRASMFTQRELDNVDSLSDSFLLMTWALNNHVVGDAFSDVQEAYDCSNGRQKFAIATIMAICDLKLTNELLEMLSDDEVSEICFSISKHILQACRIICDDVESIIIDVVYGDSTILVANNA